MSKKTKTMPLHESVLKVFHTKPTKHFSLNQILKKLPPEIKKEEVSEAVKTLLENEKIEQAQHRRYKLKKEQLFTKEKEQLGTVDATRSGNAYVAVENLHQDVFVRANNLGTAIDGDKVKIETFQTKGKKIEGKVVEVVERTHKEIVGVVETSKNFAFLIPDKRSIAFDVFIPGNKINGAKQGQKAIAKILEWPSGKNKNPIGEIIEILGDAGTHEVEMESILLESGFRLEFPEKVIAESEQVPDKISEDEIQKRRDFRDVTTFTIDPHDAKDFDDALSIRQLENGNWEIGVHIADVSHYIKPGTALEKEAAKRATSVYLVDRVVPMFPERISNFICSLRPEEEKLTYSAVFEFDKNLELASEWFGKTIIYSDKRFSYEEAQDLIEKGKGEYAEEMLQLNKIAHKLRKEKFKNGAVAFETVEVQFRIDQDGVPLEVSLKERKEAHMLIEDFMLLANKKVAEYASRYRYKEKKVPFVYRNHDVPDMEKMEIFSKFAAKFGYHLNLKTPEKISESLNKLMEEVKGKPEQNVMEGVAIRTMAKAYYSTKNIGHYGLAFDHYTHFTSPIRRYPDVMAHRALERCLKDQKPFDKKEIEDQCKHSSLMERNALTAERASVKYKQVEYMQNKLGEEFEGIISGVAEMGIFVEIIENKCEGLVRKETLEGDIFHFDEENYSLIGQNTKKQYRLGDTVKIVVVRADLERRNLDFELAEEKQTQ